MTWMGLCGKQTSVQPQLFMKIRDCCLLAVSTVSFSGPLQAAFRLDFDTDSSGTPTTGSYSGSGNVDADIVAGSPGTNVGSITGVSTGDELTVDLVDSGTVHNFAPDVFTLSTVFDIAGGNADLTFLSGNDGYFKGWSLTGLSGVTSLSFTSVYEDPIMARSDAVGYLGGVPWGFATALQDTGTGFGISDFDVKYTVNGLQYLTDSSDPSTATTSIPNYTPFTSAQWDNSAVANTSQFVTTNGFSATGINNGSHNLVVRGFDDDGSGFDSVDAASFYAHEFTVEITPGGGNTTFASDTIFNFSFDGDRQLVLPQVVPEPSALGLSAMIGLLAVSRRQRA